MIKRICDLTLSFIGIIILLPLFLAVFIFIKLDSPGPIIFKQKRVGLNGKSFYLYKFRTMLENREKGIKLTSKHDSRITRIGRFLRKHKLDELPQLINIIKGEMSFVGPRPEVPNYVELFREDYNFILRIKPGVTDYASIEFRNESKLIENSKVAENVYIHKILPQKIKLYKKYIKERSFFLDLLIILKTISRLIRK